MKEKKLLSIVVPCFNEESNVESLFKILKKVLKDRKKYRYEFIFVDNGSLDHTKEKIKKIANEDANVKGVFLSRNFGPEASTQACFDYARGDAVIALPCDLQDPPELIPKFIKKWEEGFSIVLGVYIKTEDDAFTAIMRKTFYTVFKKISNINIPVKASGVGLLDRKAIEALKSLPEKYRFFRGLRAWIGFKTAYVEYQRRKRIRGMTSYNFIDYVKHAEKGVFGFSYLVLDIMVYTGFFLVFVAFIFIIWYLFTVFIFGNPINASIPLMLTIVFFGGIQLLAISIIGKYIQVIVEETKNRPIYIVDEIVGKKS